MPPNTNTLSDSSVCRVCVCVQVARLRECIAFAQLRWQLHTWIFPKIQVLFDSVLYLFTFSFCDANKEITIAKPKRFKRKVSTWKCNFLFLSNALSTHTRTPLQYELLIRGIKCRIVFFLVRSFIRYTLLFVMDSPAYVRNFALNTVDYTDSHTHTPIEEIMWIASPSSARNEHTHTHEKRRNNSNPEMNTWINTEFQF